MRGQGHDGLGYILYCELNPREMQNPPYKLYSCHDCNIVAAQASSILPLLVTLGEDGKIFVYDFKTKMLLLQEEFDKAGTGIIWFSGRISLSDERLYKPIIVTNSKRDFSVALECKKKNKKKTSNSEKFR
uniref:Uncharacterized protein n=1 Tax=Glossina palpalis gambiensis TaxID=67801 RepID=A0A1B0BLC6_9MUSC